MIFSCRLVRDLLPYPTNSPYKIHSDYDFLMVKLFRTDGGLAYIMRDVHVSRLLQEKSKTDLSKVALYRLSTTDLDDKSKGETPLLLYINPQIIGNYLIELAVQLHSIIILTKLVVPLCIYVHTYLHVLHRVFVLRVFCSTDKRAIHSSAIDLFYMCETLSKHIFLRECVHCV